MSEIKKIAYKELYYDFGSAWNQVSGPGKENVAVFKLISCNSTHFVMGQIDVFVVAALTLITCNSTTFSVRQRENCNFKA